MKFNVNLSEGRFVMAVDRDLRISLSVHRMQIRIYRFLIYFQFKQSSIYGQNRIVVASDART